jgi:hypothetical protein
MYRLTVALCISLGVSSLPAAAAAIGVVKSAGAVMLDDQLAAANATIFDGSRLETGAASSDVDLAGGVRLRLAAASRGRVYADRLVLEKGIGELERGAGYRLEALGLRVVPTSPDSAVRVAVVGQGRLQALSLAGTPRVTTADGTVVAVLRPGVALEFQPQEPAGAQAPFEMTGCLERREGRFVLRDPLTGVVEEVRGDRLDGEVGRMLEVTATVIPGAKPVTGALEVIQIRRMRRVGGSCAIPAETTKAAAPAKPEKTAPARAPAAPPSTPGAGPAAGAGKGGAGKAVIGGVIVGGAAAGAVVYWQTQKKDETGTISR